MGEGIQALGRSWNRLDIYFIYFYGQIDITSESIILFFEFSTSLNSSLSPAT